MVPRIVRSASPWAILLAVLTVGSPVFATGVSPENATPVQREQAQAMFVRGRKAYERGKFDEAITEFRASLDIVASPNTRLLIARCLRQSGRLVEAYVEFDRVAVEAKEQAQSDSRYKQAAQAAQAERAQIEPKLGFLTITVSNKSETTKLSIGGEEIRRAAWEEPVPVMPGQAEVQVETPGQPAVRKVVTVAAGQKVNVSMDAPDETSDAPAPVSTVRVETPPAADVTTDNSSLRTFAFIAGGVGVAGLATFAVAGSMSNSSYSDLEDSCPGGQCGPDRKSDIDAGRSEQTIANIGLGVGLVGVAAGATLFILSMPSKQSTASRRTSLVLTPSWVGLHGTM